MNGWKYYKIIPANGSSAGAATNNVMSLTISYESGYMRTDFGDIRFTLEDGTALYHNILTKTDSTTATFDIKIPSIAQSGSTNIVMWSGYNSATDASDPGNTYLLFDDFEDEDDDWVDLEGADHTISSGKLNLTGNTDGTVYHPTTVQNNIIFEYQVTDASTDYWAAGVIHNSGTDGQRGYLVDLANATWSFWYGNNSWNGPLESWSGTAESKGTNPIVQICRYGGRLSVKKNGSELKYVTDNNLTSGGRVGFRQVANRNKSIGYVKVIPYIYPELSWGSVPATWSQNVTLTGVSSAGAFGSLTLEVESSGSQSITLTGIGGAESFGTPTLGLRINLTGITTGEAIGTSVLGQHITLSGVSSGEALGTSTLGLNINLGGIASGEGIGTSTLGLNISLSGLDSGEDFGSLTITLEGTTQTITLTSIESTESLGTSILGQHINLTGLSTGEGIGTPGLGLNISLSGVESGEAHGTPTLCLNINLDGISSDEEFGAIILSYPQTITLTGLSTPEALGTPTIGLQINLEGVSSDEAIGTHTLGLNIQLDGVESGEDFGVLLLKYPQWIQLSSIATGEVFGASYIWTHHAYVHAHCINTSPYTIVVMATPPPGKDGKDPHVECFVSQPSHDIFLSRPYTLVEDE